MTNIAGGRLKIPADRRAFEAQSLIGRIGDTEDIKGLALYLASPCSSYVTGSQIVIDGGSMLAILRDVFWSRNSGSEWVPMNEKK